MARHNQCLDILLSMGKKEDVKTSDDSVPIGSRMCQDLKKKRIKSIAAVVCGKNYCQVFLRLIKLACKKLPADNQVIAVGGYSR